MTRYIAYTTQAGDRWDTIAWRFYGDASNFHPIITANVSVAIYPVFPAGVALSIPIIPPPPSTQILPPWFQ